MIARSTPGVMERNSRSGSAWSWLERASLRPTLVRRLGLVHRLHRRGRRVSTVLRQRRWRKRYLALLPAALAQGSFVGRGLPSIERDHYWMRSPACWNASHPCATSSGPTSDENTAAPAGAIRQAVAAAHLPRAATWFGRTCALVNHTSRYSRGPRPRYALQTATTYTLVACSTT